MNAKIKELDFNKIYFQLEIDLYKKRTTKHPKKHSFYNSSINDVLKFVDEIYPQFADFQIYHQNKYLGNISGQ